MRKLSLLFILCYPLAANNPGGSHITPQAILELTGVDLTATLQAIPLTLHTPSMQEYLQILQTRGMVKLTLANQIFQELELLPKELIDPPPFYHGAGFDCVTQLCTIDTSTVFCSMSTSTMFPARATRDMKNCSLVEWLQDNLR